MGAVKEALIKLRIGTTPSALPSEVGDRQGGLAPLFSESLSELAMKRYSGRTADGTALQNSSSFLRWACTVFRPPPMVEMKK